jgi:hypothetical protein
MEDSPKVATAIGAKIDMKMAKIGAPPVVLQAQAIGYIVLTKPEELKQWEEDLRMTTGISLDSSNLVGIAAETCSGGCSDACDMAT